MNQLPGKVFKKILIIGSSSFLAQELIKKLIKKNLIICIDKVIKKNQQNKNLIFFKCDINNFKKLERIQKKIQKKYKFIDTVVNCFVHQNFIKFEEQTVKNFASALNTNVIGLFSSTKVFYKILKKSKNPQIINMGSIYGIVSGDPKIYPDGKVTSDVYAASKAAIIQLTKYYAIHLAKYKIRVNCVSPGGIFNHQNKVFIRNYNRKVPINRMAYVDEIVSSIEFLLNDDCKYINGHNLIVDGGFTSW